MAKISFNPSTVAALTLPPNNKDITFDLRGHNIFARGVEFKGTDTNTWRSVTINGTSLGTKTLELKNGSNIAITANGTISANGLASSSHTHPLVINGKSFSLGTTSLNLGTYVPWTSNGLTLNVSTKYGNDVDTGGGLYIDAYTGTLFYLWLHDTSNVWYKKTASGSWKKMDAGNADTWGGYSAKLTTENTSGTKILVVDGTNVLYRTLSSILAGHNTWRNILINGTNIGTNVLNLKNGSNIILSNTNGQVTISASGLASSDHNHDGRYHLNHVALWDFTLKHNRAYVTFDLSGTSLGWVNGFVSTHNDYLSSYIVNTHRTANWYVGYSENESTTEPTWYKLIHSGNYTEFAAKADHTHSQYIKRTGDTMSGALNFANSTWNLVGDDSYMGDCDIAGHFGIKAANTTYPGIAFYNNSNTLLGKLTAYSDNIKYKTYSLQFLDNGNTTVTSSIWTNPFDTYNANAVADNLAICVWGQASKLTNLSSDTGDMSLWLRRISASLATLNMVLDGEYYANGNLRLAHVSELPSKSSWNYDDVYLKLNGTNTMLGNLNLHSYGSSYIGKGGGDKSGSDYTDANIVIRSWWGITFKTYNNDNNAYLDTRTGDFGTKGNVYANLITRNDQYYVNGAASINMQNSDIIGLNSIWTNDLSDDPTEGILFARSNGNYDSIRAANGNLYFATNVVRTTQKYDYEYKVLHSGNTDSTTYLGYTYLLDSPNGKWYGLRFPSWNTRREQVRIYGVGNNCSSYCYFYCGSRYSTVWGHLTLYNTVTVDYAKWYESTNGQFVLAIHIPSSINSIEIKCSCYLSIELLSSVSDSYYIDATFFTLGYIRGYIYNALLLVSQSSKNLESGTTMVSSGLRLYQFYNNSNGPGCSYGNVLEIGGLGHGLLFAEWTGSSARGNLYYRSKRDNSGGNWSSWGRVLYSDEKIDRALYADRLYPNNEFAKGNHFLQYFNNYNMPQSGIGNAAPDTNWWHIIRMNHGNSEGYFSELAIALNSWNGVYWRTICNGKEEKTWTKLVNTSGDSMYGRLTLQENLFEDSYDSGALHLSNSNIIGVNSIYTNDYSDDLSEGIHFYRDASHVDTLRMAKGNLLFTPNRPLGGASTEYTVLHTGNRNNWSVSNVSLELYISSDSTWYPIVWGGSAHTNTDDSSGLLYKSYNVLSWQTSTLTLYSTKLRIHSYLYFDLNETHIYHDINSYTDPAPNKAINFKFGGSLAATQFRMYDISISNTNEINCDSTLYLNYSARSNLNIVMCNGTGIVGIGSIRDNWKLNVGGNTYISGVLLATNEIRSSSANAFRLNYGSYGVFHRNDGADYYILLTNLNDINGAWNDYRPFRINLASGTAYLNGWSTNANVAERLLTSQITDLNEPSYWNTNYIGLVFDDFNNSASNKPQSVDNANAVITLLKSKHGTDGLYCNLLAFADNREIYTRQSVAGKWGNWVKLITSENITNYYWANVKISATSNSLTLPSVNTIYASNWFRSTGQTGWYSQTYGGGWYMSDTTCIRAFNNKSIYSTGYLHIGTIKSTGTDLNIYSDTLFHLKTNNFVGVLPRVVCAFSFRFTKGQTSTTANMIYTGNSSGVVVHRLDVGRYYSRITMSKRPGNSNIFGIAILNNNSKITDSEHMTLKATIAKLGIYENEILIRIIVSDDESENDIFDTAFTLTYPYSIHCWILQI